MNYIPLRIVAHMSAPISMMPHEGLCLDSILEYVVANSRRWRDSVVQRVILPQSKDGSRRLPRGTAINFRIPVKRIGHRDDPNWVWSCSWAEFPEGFETDMTHWNKRFDGGVPSLAPHLDIGRASKVSLSSGRYKAYHMPLPLVVTPLVRWFVNGDPARIAELLTRVTHLGKKVSQGNGQVTQWWIYRHHEDWSLARDGKPMRAIPDRPGDHRRRHIGLRPPYWHHETRRLCIAPERLASGLLG